MAASVLGELALLEAGRGRLHRAVELATDAVEDAELGGPSVGTPLVGAGLALGWAHFLWNDLAAAERQLDRAAAAADAADDRRGRLASTALRSLVRGAQGPREAGAALAELRGRTRDLDGWRPPLALAPILETAEARLLAARGDLEAAHADLERRSARTGESAAIALLQARLSLAEGAPEAALEFLERWPRGAADESRLADRGVRADAPSPSMRCTTTTAPERRSSSRSSSPGRIATAGPSWTAARPSRLLLEQRIRWGTAHRSFAGELLDAFRKRAPNAAVTKAELLEPLSVREQSVLRFLPTMMSNAEIAGELFVTSNTVKTHLKSIYRKLAVSRRRDAVERARALELL